MLCLFLLLGLAFFAFLLLALGDDFRLGASAFFRSGFFLFGGRQQAVDDDLIGIGFRPGPAIGRVLQKLLEEVVRSPELNTKDALLRRARELRR